MPDAERRADWLAVGVIVALLVVGRSLVFVVYEQTQFDADQAVMGLTAKHIGQGRAHPVFQYAQRYVLVVEAWIAAPFVAIGGTSVAMLRSPLVLLNLVAGWLLVWMTARELRLSPLLALVPALFFVAAPPVLAAELVTALGGNIEPFVYVLVLWLLREQPIPFGVILVVGFLNREFTAYAAVALLAVEALQGRLWQRDNVRRTSIALVAAILAWQAVRLLAARSDVLGPGSADAGFELPASNLSILAAFVCPAVDPARIAANLGSLVTTQLPILLGAAPFALARVNIASPISQGLPGAWPVLAGVLLAALGRTVWLIARTGGLTQAGAAAAPADAAVPVGRERRFPAPSGLWFDLYLALIGIQSGVAWAVSRCGPLDPIVLRYALLMVLLPSAVVGAHLAVEPRRLWRMLTVAAVVAWTAVSFQAHARLLEHVVWAAPPSEYRYLADELEARGVRYVLADYWAAYMISFLTDERVTATPTDMLRILEYERAVMAHPDETVLISRRRCPGGQAFRMWHFCRPPASP